MKKTRKGFTLVELLIVIVVIGILSAMMMMSSNEAVTTARANNIITNLRALKTAALAYYTDHMNEKTFTKEDVTEGMFSYLGKQAEIEDKANYIVEIKDGKWYVYYDTTKSNMMGTQDIRKKLRGRAKSIGLLDRSQSSGKYTDYSEGHTSQGVKYGGQYPAIRVR